MKQFKYVFLALFLLFACSKHEQKKEVTDPNPKEIVVGSFNLEWLGDGINDRNPRSEMDYENIAKIIQQSGVEVLGVQEVENFNALARLIKFLPEYSFFIVRDDAPQKVGIIFRKNCKVKFIATYSPLEVETRRTRPGLVAAVEKGGLDFLILVVHLKATSRFDNTPEKIEESRSLRLRQAELIGFWVDSVLAHNDEEDLIILGDLNDTPLRKKFNTLVPLLLNSNLKFLTDSLRSCKLSTAYVIDHIVVTESLLRRYINKSAALFDHFHALSEEEASKISDHCLIFSRFDVTLPDNDPSKYFKDKKEIAER